MSEEEIAKLKAKIKTDEPYCIYDKEGECYEVKPTKYERFEIIRAKDWKPPDVGTLASRVVLAKFKGNPVTPYATFVEVRRDDGTTDLIWGHYVNSSQVALEDYLKREV